MNTTISQSSVWGEIWQTQANMAQPKPRSDKEIRESYNAHVSQAYQDFLKEAAEFHANDQCFGDDLGRKAFDMRNTIKEAHQAKTSFIGRVGIWVRNLVTYGAGNATYEGLSKKKNPEELAYSAFKTDGSDLGLSGNGFGDVLNTWNAIKEVSTLYPEDITPEMIAAFKAQPRGNVDPTVILAARTGVVSEEQVQVQKLAEEVLSRVHHPAPVEVFSKDELFAVMKPAHQREFVSYI